MNDLGRGGSKQGNVIGSGCRVTKDMRTGVVAAAVTIATACIAAAAVAESTSETTGGADVEALLTERCTRCHDISVVHARRATADEWHEIIERMLTNGAQVSEDEAEAIVGYLAKTQGPDSSAG